MNHKFMQNYFKPIVLPIILIISLLSLIIPLSGAVTFPSGVNYAYPINIINTNTLGTPANFQDLITFNALGICNAILCNSHLNNTEFFYSNGVIINSWYESANGLNNNYASNSFSTSNGVNVWVLLGPASFISGSGNTIIYLGFASNSINNFNSLGTTGEAPELTNNYAAYDNGNSIFNFYDNFYGNTLDSLWTPNVNTGIYTVNNGLTIKPNSNNQWNIYSTANVVNNNAIVEDWLGNMGVSSGANHDTVIGLVGQAYVTSYADDMASIGTSGGPTNGLFTTTTAGTANRQSLIYPFNSNYIYSISITSNTLAAVTGTFNYLSANLLTSSSDLPTYPLAIGFISQSAGSTDTAQWIRTRTYPLGGIMPNSIIGTIMTPPIVSGCGTEPSSISSLIVSCISTNVINTQSIATSTNFQQEFSGLSFNALIGNVVVYNGLSGSLMSSWIENSSIIWVNLGANTIAALSNANGVYYFGFGNSITNFLSNSIGNDIGEAPEFSPAYGQYDNGNVVFPYYQKWGGLAGLPSGWASSEGIQNFNPTNTVLTSGTGFSGYVETPIPGLFTIANSPFVIDMFGSLYTTQSSVDGFPLLSANTLNVGVFGYYGGGNCAGGSSPIICITPPQEVVNSVTLSNTPAVYTVSIISSNSLSQLYNYQYLTSVSGTSLTYNQLGFYQQGKSGAQQSTVIYWERGRVYPPNGIMPTVTYPYTSNTPILSVTPNPAIYGQSVTLTATCASSDTCDIDYPSLGTHLATGTSSASYTYNAYALAAGNYLTYYANDVSSGSNSIGVTLTVDQATPPITLPSFPAPPNSITYNGLTYTFTANIATYNSQLTANIYINNVNGGSFTTQITNTINGAANTYEVVANTLGNANYIATSVSNSLVINKASPPLTWIAQCSSGVYTSACTTTANIITYNSQIDATLWVGTTNTGTTTTQISNTINAIGSYTYTFNTLGNGNYLSNSISYSFSLNGECGTVPSSISSYLNFCIPVNIVNTQNTITPVRFQQALSGLSYNGLAGNIVVYNGLSGKLVEAWVESPTLIWIDLGANTIAANAVANGVYYLGIGGPGTNFFSTTFGNDIGECPQCSTNYGQYDNGNQLFAGYTNFNGVKVYPPGWIDNSNAGNPASGNFINDGFYIPAASAPSSGDTAILYNTQVNPQNTIAEFYGYVQDTSGSSWGYAWGDYSESATCVFYEVTAYDGDYGMANANGCSGETFGWVTSSVPSTGTTNHVLSVWTTSANSMFSIDYATPLINSNNWNSVNSGEFLGLLDGSGQQASIFAQWARTRLLPPNGQMPAITYGSTQSIAHPTISISPNPAIYGQSITITATCPSGGTCDIDYPSLGTHLATNTGGSVSYTYSAGALIPGTYSNYYANDITGSSTSIGNVLTVNQAPTPLSWTAQCVILSLGVPCTTTANIITFNNQLSATLWLGNSNLGSTTTTISNTINSLGSYTYTFNTLGNGNYIGNSISYTVSSNGVSIYAENTIGTLSTNSPIAITWNTVYPIELYAINTNPSLTFNLFQSISGITTQLISDAINFTYIPPATQPSGNYVYTAQESESGGYSTVNVIIAVNTLNMADILSPLSFNGICSILVQYDENCAGVPTFSVTPKIWGIYSDNPINPFIANTIYQGNNIDIWSNGSITFTPNVLLNYFGFYSGNILFQANAVNNAALSPITQYALGYVESNVTPSSPYTRRLFNITSWDQQFLTPLNAVTTTSFSWGFNNYTGSNSITINTNVVGSIAINSVWIANSLFSNPTYTMNNIVTTSSAVLHITTINNYLPVAIGTWPTFPQYLPNIANSTSDQFYIYGCSGYASPGGYISITTAGQGRSTYKTVQQYKYNAVPFNLNLQNSQSYGFTFLNSAGGIIYTQPPSTSSSPITIYLPCTPVNVIPVAPVINATCAGIVSSNILVCSAVDTQDYVQSWNISVSYNPSILSSKILFSNIITAPSFTSAAYQLPNHTTQYYVSVYANVGRNIDPYIAVIQNQALWVIKGIAPSPSFAYNGLYAIILFLIFIAVAYVNEVAAIIGFPIVMIIAQTMGFLSLPSVDVYGSIVIMVVIGVLLLTYRE